MSKSLGLSSFGLVITIALFFFSNPAAADVLYVKGQTVYVAVYSHIYSGDQERPLYLTATLSIRNTDQTNKIRLLSVDYHGSDGTLLKKYINSPLSLAPLASERYVIKESDKSGGSGASFIVKWQADRQVSPPLIESIMISAKGQQGISFTSRGQVIKEIVE